MRCGTCGAATRRGAKFCDQCGSQLGDVVVPKRRAASGATDVEPGDRRIVTALFADLVDYVRLVAEHDPEDVRRQVDQALMAMVEAIEAFGGTREKFIGDAVFAVFGWPNGHDDDALRASHCGLAIREALSRVAASTSEEPLQVRIGIATGEVVAAPRGDGSGDWSLTGPAVTTAARIQTIAQPGEILLDEATLRATRKGFEVEDRGPQLLRGQTKPIRVARLIGEAGFQPWRPPVGLLIGREKERARLRALLDAVTPQSGAAIVVEGEAGMGKSRLMAELATAAPSAGFVCTWVDNVSYGAQRTVSIRASPRPGHRRRARHGLRGDGSAPPVHEGHAARTGATVGRRRRRDRAGCRVLRLGGGSAAGARRACTGRDGDQGPGQALHGASARGSGPRDHCSSTTSIGSILPARGCSMRSSG